MRVTFKLAQKHYVELIQFVAKLDHTEFLQIGKIDVINIRQLYFDALRKYEAWRYKPEYHRGIKPRAISMDINHLNSLNKLLYELELRKKARDHYYEVLLHDIVKQTTWQIDARMAQLSIN